MTVAAGTDVMFEGTEDDRNSIFGQGSILLDDRRKETEALKSENEELKVEVARLKQEAQASKNNKEME